jgi:hypothetical protein
MLADYWLWMGLVFNGGRPPLKWHRLVEVSGATVQLRQAGIE